MGKVFFRFYEELNDSLPSGLRKRDFEVHFTGHKTVREMIENLGVPAGKVDLILVGGRSVGFAHRPEAGERISVYPVFERLNIEGTSRLRKKPLRRLRFVAEPNLEGLAESLTASGFDVFFDPGVGSEMIFRIARSEGRILLTRHAQSMDSQPVDRVIVVKGESSRDQLRGVLQELQLDAE